MPQENCQKIKLLKLIELLQQETDDQHPLRTSEICSRLTTLKISCDRRTLSKDMAILNDQGFEVMSTLIDAVQAANFITQKKSGELIDKIANLGGSRCAEILRGNVVCFNTRRQSNEAIYYNVGFLEEALKQKKKASFYYFDLNENGLKVYRAQKERYIVEP